MNNVGNLENCKCIRIGECESRLLNQFWISEDKNAESLVNYLRSPRCALLEENDGTARTYVVIDEDRDCIIRYFTLRAGQCFVEKRKGFRRKHYVFPGVELAMFAINDRYKQAQGNPDFSFGEWVFRKYILPKIQESAKLIGIKMIYLFALPGKLRLVKFYENLGFQNPNNITINNKRVRTIKPAFDAGCIFMFRKIK